MRHHFIGNLTVLCFSFAFYKPRKQERDTTAVYIQAKSLLYNLIDLPIKTTMVDRSGLEVQVSS